MTQQEKAKIQEKYIKAQREILAALLSDQEPDCTRRDIFNFCRPEYFIDEAYIYNSETDKSKKVKLEYRQYFKICKEIFEAGNGLDFYSFSGKVGAVAAAEIYNGNDAINFHLFNAINAVAAKYIEDEKEKLLADFNAGKISANDYADDIKRLYSENRPKEWQKRFVTDLSLEEPEPEPLLTRNEAPILCRGEYIVIAGATGSFKSFLALTLAAAAMNGGARIDNTLGIQTSYQNLKVLFIDTELPRRAYRFRLQCFKKMTGRQSIPENFYLSLNGVVTDEKRELVTACISQLKPDIAIFDNAVDFVHSFNDEKEATEFKDYIKRLAVDYNMGIVVTNHLNTKTTQGGSDENGLSTIKQEIGDNKGHIGRILETMSDLTLRILPNSDEKSKTVVFSKERNIKPERFSFIFNKEIGGLDLWEPGTDKTEAYKKLEEQRELITKAFNNDISVYRGDLITRLGTLGVGEKKATYWVALNDAKDGTGYKTAVGRIIYRKEARGPFYLIPLGESQNAADNDLPFPG